MTVYVNGEGQNTTNSAGIVDGSIVNADISSSAAIAASKISGTALVASTADAKGDLYVASAADTVGRLAVGADGTVPTANAGDTAGIGYAYPDATLPSAYRASSTIKACTVDPMQCTAAATIADGSIFLGGIYLPYDATLTGIAWVQAVQGDTTADNENRVGLYTSNGTNLTLVASCADDGTLWETGAANTVVQKAFSSTYPAQAGRYWIGILKNVSAEATPPQIRNAPSAANSVMMDVLMSDTDEFVMATVASATLASSIAWSSCAASAGRYFLAVY